jgi:hypothetical protein
MNKTWSVRHEDFWFSEIEKIYSGVPNIRYYAPTLHKQVDLHLSNYTETLRV